LAVQQSPHDIAWSHMTHQSNQLYSEPDT